MSVSRSTATATARISPSGCVVGGWLLTTAAVGGFAFVAGDNIQSTIDTPTPMPAVASIEAPALSQGSAVAVYLPTRAGALSDGRVTVAVTTPAQVQSLPADIACGLNQRAGLSISRVHAPDRAAHSSNSRGPASVARVSATACRLAATQATPAKPAIKAASAASGH
ncbi:hypothetical protein [Williamsia sp. 1135]|uniref:hypothetical protein n=1 Tax=Williamsia sp. 1135 TaxID=1889262 RepID=UPI000A0F4BC8|nr:hypothetical protein [Williamsia sp. 1135]ORM36887.1 hypothetical protein BFL43_05885 [Williamsia sp. 1135]